MKEPIYLDHHATTPVAPEAFEAMAPYFCEFFGNPASSTHSFGWKAEAAVTKARSQIAKLIGAKIHEIYFTSGATESNNWALFGLIENFRKNNPNKKMHIITSETEHSSNLASFKKAGLWEDVDLSILPTNRFGQVTPEAIKEALRDETIYISLIYGNNEIGSLNPIKEISQITRERGILLHTDAAQVCGNIPVSVDDLGVDLMSLASHKMYGPKGIGALYIRSLSPKVSIAPLIEGGGQERGLRSGTLNVPGIVGFGAAAELAESYIESKPREIRELSTYLINSLKEFYPNLQLNGHPTERLPGNVNITLPGVSMARLLPRLSHIALSSSSACGSGSTKMSHVLAAIGLNPESASQSLRFGLGRSTTKEQLDQVIEAFSQVKPAVDLDFPV